jgi:hypothetical protein
LDLLGLGLNSGAAVALTRMTDAADYFMDHARDAVQKARRMQRGAWRDRQRRVARVYHLLAKRAGHGSEVARIDDFRTAKGRPRRLLP